MSEPPTIQRETHQKPQACETCQHFWPVRSEYQDAGLCQHPLRPGIVQMRSGQ